MTKSKKPDYDQAEWAESPYSKKRYKKMKKLLKDRLSERRFAHSVGVAKTSKWIAEAYGLDADKAKMAGLLHDWDKCMDADSMRDHVRALQVDIDPFIIEEMPWLLHGPTAAVSLRAEYPFLGEDVLSAIARHTSGATDMSDLDCIVYTADLIEPGRDFGEGSGLDDLRALVGRVSLQELYYQAFKFTFRSLIERDKPLFPQTCDIYNALCGQHAERVEEERAINE